MSSYKIFIVEDDEWYGEILKYHLSLNPEYEIHLFSSGKECLLNMHLGPDIISIDYQMPDMNGDVLYEKIKEINDQIPVIIISSQQEVSVALNLLKSGVYDYLIKDENIKDLLWNSIVKSRERDSLKTEIFSLKKQLKVKFNFKTSIIGQSPAVNRIFELVEKAAQTNINVSISGETGTGKEVVAKAIHYQSPRADKSFVAINMAAIPKELVESELFGHEKGSFTGAGTRKIGKFEEANHGTLFLDEIAEMDLNLQSKILRVIQEREFTRVGGNEVFKINIRLITATHKNLLDEVKKGNFREDLFYRIIGFPIEIPPLRERGNDILLLARHFISEFCHENNLEPVSLSNKASKALLNYSYPGNVRELKSMVELAVVMSNGKEIDEPDIIVSKSNEIVLGQDKKLKDHIADIIGFYLKKYENDVLKVAAELDIGKSTIYKMLKNEDIKLEERLN